MIIYGFSNHAMATSSHRFTSMDIFRYIALPVLTVVLLTSCIFRKPHDNKTHVVIGEVADLNDDMFSEKYWRKGLIKPEEFVRKPGVGIYFLEEYNNKKTPMLFINGIYGSPQLWELFFKGMNRARYQPWFFSYPTGMSLTESTGLLAELLEGLRKLHGFKEMHITAHGTGGLLARSLIIEQQKRDGQYCIKGFISIATPWGGFKIEGADELGSSGPIPALVDIQPDSPFFKALYKNRMGFSLDHYMFVAYNTGMLSIGSIGGPPSLKSQLYFKAQTEAVKEYGFYEGYLGILSSAEVVRKYNKILSTKDGP